MPPIGVDPYASRMVIDWAETQRMRTGELWKSLREKLRGPDRRTCIVLQHLGLPASDTRALQEILFDVGRQLAVTLELHSHEGEIVLLEAPFAAGMSPQLVESFAEGRPVIRIDDWLETDTRYLSPVEQSNRRRRTLLQQLKGLAIVRSRSTHWGSSGWIPEHLRLIGSSVSDPGPQGLAYDSGFDSVFDSEQLLAEPLDSARQDLLQQVLHGMLNRSISPLTASYGPDAHMKFDFFQGYVTLDPLAQQHLRIRRELPIPLPLKAPLPLKFEATVREIDDVVWDLGIASGRFQLARQPANWWHSKLESPISARIECYTRVPIHLEMARCLRASPMTPSELRRSARISIAGLRSFLQACLLLNLVHWQQPAANNDI